MIDDASGKTLAAVDTRSEKGTLTERSVAIGKAVAEKAQATGVKEVVFDRGGFRYQGAIAALADSARAAGLVF